MQETPDPDLTPLVAGDPDPEALARARLAARAHETTVRVERAALGALGQALRSAAASGWSTAVLAKACELSEASVEDALKDA